MILKVPRDVAVSNNTRSTNPFSKANILSRLTFWWLRHLFQAGLRKPIDESEIYASLPEDGSAKLSTEFDNAWQTERLTQQRPNLFRVMRKTYFRQVVPIGVLVYILDIACRLALPQCLGGLVMYFTPTADGAQTAAVSSDAALAYAAGLVACSFMSAALLLSVTMYFFRLGMRVRLTCSALVYKKTLRMTACASPAGMAGHVINLMSTDVTRFNAALVLIHDLWRGPVELLLMGYLIWGEIGVWGMWGLTVMCAFLPLQAWASQRTAFYRKRTVKHADDRMRRVAEVMQAIQVIKMYTWERWFEGNVDKVRCEELRGIRGTQMVNGFLGSTRIISRVAVFVSLSTYAYYGNVFEARQVFVVTTYFSYIYSSLFMNWSMAWSAMAQTLVSVARIERFLLLPETKAELMVRSVVKPDQIRQMDEHVETVKGVIMENVVASWRTDTKTPTTGLRNVNLRMTDRGLHTIIGAVGSGKTTLLQVLLGELGADSGQVRVNGIVSFASQEPWLFDGTVRENIVFMDDAFDVMRYNQVIEVCGLMRDLSELSCGDQTRVGERGVCLSGGQRARINLARAVYKKADIYLLDDPLSAVDAAVGLHIYKECIEKFLKNEICILVTHQLQYLTQCQHTICMESGRIISEGSFERLQEIHAISMLLRPTERRLSTLGQQQQKQQTIPKSEDKLADNSAKISSNADTNETGSVEMSFYWCYFEAVKSNWLVLFVGISFLLAQISSSVTDYFVAKWVSVKDVAEMRHDGDRRLTLMQIYSALVLIVITTVSLRVFGFFQMCLRASRNIHRLMYDAITSTDMCFFKMNATGQILNRFSRDMDNVDTNLPVAFSGVLTFILEMLAIVLLVIMTNWWLLVPTSVLAVLLYLIRYVYMQTSRSIKRIEASTLSPMFSHTNTTLQGITTIRAFRAEQQFADKFDAYQDLNTSVRFLFLATGQAFALWLEMATVFYMASVVASFMYLRNDDSAGGRVGLAITQILNLTMMCKYGMRHSAILENQMVSIERINEYVDLPSEESESMESRDTDVEWPQHGALTFKSVSLQYTPKGCSALRDISFNIRPREKIGVVGRTGAGKSSIIQALFRLARTDGSISIDGIDIATVTLKRLRSSIAIIPQEAVLFNGTMRSNLDPFAEHADEQLWMALEQVELRSTVAAMDGGLDCVMTGDSAGFSMGQRQLVCLARAILRKNRILILDEATANVDAQTDRLIQRSIRENFRSCTVLTIAHRLQTIEDSDRVLVMDAGRVVEFDRPKVLRRTRGGYFSRMCSESYLSGIGDQISGA